MTRGLKFIQTLIRLGLRRLWLNLLHRLRLKSGWYKVNAPARPWGRSGIKGRSPFTAPTKSQLLRAGADVQAAVAKADRIVNGELTYFSNHWHPFPDDWAKNPRTGYGPDCECHWSDVPFFDPKVGDIKWVWEPSRFDWAAALCRAHILTEDRKYSDRFWALLEDWKHKNPPNIGPNWMCGQECSMRMFALLQAIATLPATEEQEESLWELVTALAERIEPAIIYSLSQHNNHGLDEACGLYLAGCCLPDNPNAGEWIAKGRRLFIKQCVEQFRPDGSYVQNSFNYERVALRAVQLVLLAAREFGDDLPPVVQESGLNGARFLASFINPNTGWVPNSGYNDGSYVLNFCGSEYEDYRPTLGSMALTAGGFRIFKEGPWLEEAVWFVGEKAFSASEELQTLGDRLAPEGGCFALRSGDDMVMLRCQAHRDRPADSDALHLDVWLNGVPVACDGGTYNYADPEESKWFKSTIGHNTVMVNDQDQMEKISRWLWTDWTQAQFHGQSDNAISGSHPAYYGRFGVTHRREVKLLKDGIVVIDDLLVSKPQKRSYCLRWHLNGEAWEQSDSGVSSENAKLRVFSSSALEQDLVTEGLEASQSLHYGGLTPSPCLRSRTESLNSVRLVTVFGAIRVRTQEEQLNIGGQVVPLSPFEVHRQ